MTHDSTIAFLRRQTEGEDPFLLNTLRGGHSLLTTPSHGREGVGGESREG